MANFAFALILSSCLVLYAGRKKSLSSDGLVGAFALGMITFTSSFYLFTVVLLVFFLTSSKLTKFGAKRKRSIEDDYDKSAQRNFIQVVCNGLTGGILAGVFQFYVESENTCCFQSQWGTILIWAYIGHYACCAGDTWASELGVLNRHDPFLITSFRRVYPGTNGGVSPLGLAASVAGGATVGFAADLAIAFDARCHGSTWMLVILGAFAGLGGSLIDSILGATVQETLYSKEKKKIVTYDYKDTSTTVVSGRDFLDNHQVNFISSLSTAFISGAAAWYMYPS